MAQAILPATHEKTAALGRGPVVDTRVQEAWMTYEPPATI